MRVFLIGPRALKSIAVAGQKGTGDPTHQLWRIYYGELFCRKARSANCTDFFFWQTFLEYFRRPRFSHKIFRTDNYVEVFFLPIQVSRLTWLWNIFFAPLYLFFFFLWSSSIILWHQWQDDPWLEEPLPPFFFLSTMKTSTCCWKKKFDLNLCLSPWQLFFFPLGEKNPLHSTTHTKNSRRFFFPISRVDWGEKCSTFPPLEEEIEWM